jgi:fructose-bisphosphate aldolase class I
VNNDQLEKVRSAAGFVAALDQSGGSTPKALADYGVAKDSYRSDAEMFDLVHAMRTRIITNSAFEGDKILAAILFEQTMDREIDAVPTAQYLWEQKHVVPVLKVDKGLADEENGVQVMKPIDGLDDLLARASTHEIFGTKMRSVIHAADDGGVSAVLDQQFEYAHQIAAAGFVPIIEPEVSIDSSSKEHAEDLLLDGLRTRLQALPESTLVMLKLTLPTRTGLYSELSDDPHVLRVLALSGGYSRDEACTLLATNRTMVASFSRALTEGLSAQQTEDEFTERLHASIAQIYDASVAKDAATAR